MIYMYMYILYIHCLSAWRFKVNIRVRLFYSENQSTERLTRVDLENQVKHIGAQLEQKFEARIKQMTASKMDKVASSILHAVDQKFSKDSELKQKIFYKLDERISTCENEISHKGSEMGNLINSKIMSLRTEFEDSIKEIRRTCKIMVEQIDT